MGARHDFRELFVDHKLSVGQSRDVYIGEVGSASICARGFSRSLFAVEGRRPAETETPRSAQGQKHCRLDEDGVADPRRWRQRSNTSPPHKSGDTRICPEVLGRTANGWRTGRVSFFRMRRGDDHPARIFRTAR
jgi:hypothetical protein